MALKLRCYQHKIHCMFYVSLMAKKNLRYTKNKEKDIKPQTIPLHKIINLHRITTKEGTTELQSQKTAGGISKFLPSKNYLNVNRLTPPIKRHAVIE